MHNRRQRSRGSDDLAETVIAPLGEKRAAPSESPPARPMIGNTATIRTLFRAELRMLVRDRRAMVTSVVLPLLVMPLLLFASSWTARQREQTLEETTYRYAVTGSEAPDVRAAVAAALDHAARKAAKEAAAAPTGESAAQSDSGQERAHVDRPVTVPRFEEVPSEDARVALEAGRLHFILEGMTAEEARQKEAEAAAAEAAAKPKGTAKTRDKENEDDDDRREHPIDGAPVVRIVYRADRDDSSAGIWKMADILRESREAARTELLAAHGFPVPPEKAGTIIEADLASKEQVAGLVLGRSLTLFLLVFLLPSAAIVAMDSLAGEKERGTLETLLTTAAGRTEIIVAKLLAILAVTFAITLIQAGNLLLYVGLKFIPLPAGLAAAVNPGVAVLLVILFLPVATLISGALLVTSGYAKTYKEAQLYFLPVFLLGLLPALAPFLPGLPLQSAIVLVPVANIAIAVREILVGNFDWPMIAISWVVTVAAAGWTVRLSVRSLSAENLITASETDGENPGDSHAKFGRHVLRWFAAMWAVLLVLSSYTSTADVRVQAAVNIIGLFFGTSLLLLWRYRLDPRAALALRAPRPAVWVGVLFGVPSGILTGMGVFRLANLVFPIPPEMIEAFSQSLLPEDVPLWQILVFLALTPGVFEEITFRGILLHGLHRRMHPAAVALVVGLIFGIFHVALFRIVPTAFLGVLFAAVMLMTGSIFPTIVWHALHNALALLAGLAGLPLGELDPVVYVAGAGILAASLWIIWRNRTPYPGLVIRRRSPLPR